MTWNPYGEHPNPDVDGPIYALGEQRYTHKIDCGHDRWLLVNDPGDSSRVEFALFEFSVGEIDGDKANYYTIVFHGDGYSGALRECRHVWWGEEGYTFYLPLDATARALQALKEWFD